MFDIRFFSQISFPLAHVSYLGPFRIVLKIRGDISNFMFITGVVDTGDKLFTVTPAIYCRRCRCMCTIPALQHMYNVLYIYVFAYVLHQVQKTSKNQNTILELQKTYEQPTLSCLLQPRRFLSIQKTSFPDFQSCLYQMLWTKGFLCHPTFIKSYKSYLFFL